jgi:phage-related protein
VASDAEIDLVVNATRALSTVQRDLDELVRTAENSTDPVQVQAALNQIVSLNRVQDDLNQVIRAAQAAADDITLRADVDTDDAVRGTRRLTDTFGRLIRTAGAVAGPLAAVVGSVGAVSVAASGAASLVAGLVAATESIVPASAVAASGILTLVVASASLTLGMQGVGDAISSAFDPDVKPEDLAEQLKRLAPEARVFVKELASMKREFKALQLDVQNRLFEDLDKVLESTAKSVLPAFERGVDSAASSFNAMAVGVGAAAKELGDRGTLGAAIRSSENSLRSLERVPGQLTLAFGQLAAAAGPSLERLADKAADVADRISESLSQSFESGELQDAIELAIDNIQQLGRIAGNIFSGLGNIIRGLSTEGEGLFGTLEKLSEAFEDLTASKEFQAGLEELAKTAAQIARLVLPLVVDAFKLLGDILVIIGPPIRDIIEIVGTGLQDVFKEARPVWIAASEAFAEFLPILEPFIELAFELIRDVLPSLTPLFETLRDIFIELAPVAEQLADNIGAQLKPILEELPGILEKLLEPMVELAQKLLPILLDALIEIGPSLGELGQAFADLLVELTPLLVKFLEFQVFLVEELGPAIGPIAELILDVFIGALGALVMFIQDFVIPIVQTVVAILEGDWSAAMTTAAGVVVKLKDNASRAFEELKRRAGQAVSQLASDVIRRAGEMASGFVDAIQRLVFQALERIESLPGAMIASLGNTGQLLFNAGADIIRGLINGITSQISALTSTLGRITDLIPIEKGPLDVDRVLLTPAGEEIMGGLIRGIESQIPALRRELSGITAIIPQSVADPMSAMQGGSLNAMQPQVNVFIGAERLDARIDFRVGTANARDRRTSAQGVRL